MRALSFLTLVMFVAAGACSSEDSGSSGPSGTGGASTGGSGGVAGGIAGGSFGGSGGVATGGSGAMTTGGTGAAAGAGGAAGTGGTGGGAGTTDAGVDAPLVCDSSGGLDCSPSQTTSYQCADPPPNSANQVKNAIVAVLNQNPTWFDYNQGFPCCPLALQPKSFIDAVVAGINADGLCAKIDPNNPNIEIVVKRNNKCSEQYVVLTSANIVRNPPKYQGACVPAWL